MTWTCAECDTVNESVSGACVVCGLARPRVAASSPSADARLGSTGMHAAPAAGATAVQPAAAPTWCQACGAAVGPGLRFCGQCGADQFGPVVAPVLPRAAAHAPVGLAPPDDLYPARGGAGRTIAAVLGVIFVALIAAVGAYLIASKSSTTAGPPSTSNDPSSGAVSAGTSSTTTASTTTTSSSTTSTVVASPSTTVGAPTSTAAGAAGPLAPPGATKEELAALDLAQQFANALATKDAAALARLQPGKTAAGYDDLRASTAILKSSEAVGASVYNVRLGLVAHEETTDRHTHVYCVTWSVDLAAGHVTETGKASTVSPQYPGWVDPATLVDYVRTSC